MTPVPHLTWEKRLKKRSSETGRSLTRFDSIRELLRKKPNIFAFIMCAAGVARNILLSNEVTVLDLPLYLDTAGTIAVAVMGGYLPGVIVGFTTNFIRCIYNTTSVYYGVLSVLIAVAATLILKTENLGVKIENTTTITGDASRVYVALSGDEVALTDIRLNYL